jgi:hypothetical protein
MVWGGKHDLFKNALTNVSFARKDFGLAGNGLFFLPSAVY